MCVDFSSKIYFWELSLFNEAIFKWNLKNFNEQLAHSTARYRWWTLLATSQRSPLTSQLLCVWLAVSNAHFPVLSWKPSESVKMKISTAHISKTKTNFSKIPSKLFSGLQNLVIEINLSRRSSWPLSYIKILKNSIHSEWFSEIVSSFKNFDLNFSYSLA